MCLKEIPQDPEDERGWYPNPYTRNQNIGSGGRVWYTLYFRWRESRLSGTWAQAQVIMRGFFFSSGRGFGLTFHPPGPRRDAWRRLLVLTAAGLGACRVSSLPES